MKRDLLLPEIEGHIKKLFGSYDRPYLLYHNYDHTARVAGHASEIADHYPIDLHSRFVVVAAAWFHDTGQLTGDPNVHEETGVQFMKDFFSGRSVDPGTIDEIARCIMATKMPVHPTSQLEEIICDADTYHVGTEDFRHLDQLVWQELEMRFGIPIDDQVKKSLQFLEDHRFFTMYCQQLLSAGKNKNIALLRDMLQNHL